MLGFVTTLESGAADRLLFSVAETLNARGCRLAGAVQINTEPVAGRVCDMDLMVLAGDRRVRISQNLGILSRGCRLDADALETAVGLVVQALDAGAQLLVVNKFGRQEAEGRGFRPIIGRALAGGVPVLTSVTHAKRPGFDSFAEDLGTELPADIDAVLAWCNSACVASTHGVK